jgi:hypothetical protein
MLIKANNRNRAQRAAMLLDTIIAAGSLGPVKGANKVIAEFRRNLEEMK